MRPRPIYIVGCPRSGNTLLACVLSRHPDLFIFFERGTLSSLYRRWMARRRRCPDEPAAQAFALNLVEAWENWISNRTSLRVDPEDVSECARRSDGTYGDMLHRTMTMLMHQVKPKATCWGDKTPQHLGCLTEIHEVYPESRIIYIRRDPRSVVESLSRSSFHPASDDPLFNTEIVRQYWRGYRVQRERIDTARLFELRYEALVTSTEATLRELCDFLDVSYTAELLGEAGVDLRRASGWPSYKGWGEVRESHARPAVMDPMVLGALAGTAEDMGYSIPSASLRHRLAASVRLLPQRLFDTLLSAAYRAKHPVSNTFFRHKKLSLEDIMIWCGLSRSRP